MSDFIAVFLMLILLAFSYGMLFRKPKYIFFNFDIKETSIVSVPANIDAVFLLWQHDKNKTLKSFGNWLRRSLKRLRS